MTKLTIGDFAQRVRDLARQPVRTPEELARWQAAAAQLRMAVTPVVADQVPHLVWHYLDDADIRFRDDQYRQNQEQELEAALQGIANDERLTEPLQPTRAAEPNEQRERARRGPRG